MSNAEIVKKLHEYREARDGLKALRLELARVAVELGADQLEMLNGGAPSFLDGYLVSQGIVPESRIEVTP